MYHLDRLDHRLVLLLQQDGRATYAELARAVNVSEATVRRRLERLIEEQVIEVVACVRPQKVGLKAEAFVYLRTDLDKLVQIGQQLTIMPQVREVVYTSGSYDLVVRLVLPSGEDLLPFLTQQIASIPGIRATQTSYVLEVKKCLQDWQLPQTVLSEKTSLPGPTILLVDDDADFVAGAKMVLDAAGYQTTVACNGRDALACLAEEPPGLILLDLMMETPLAGLEVARAVHQGKDQPAVPILAISAIRSTEWAHKLPLEEELPLDGFLDKPIEPSVLLNEVQRLLEESRAD